MREPRRRLNPSRDEDRGFGITQAVWADESDLIFQPRKDAALSAELRLVGPLRSVEQDRSVLPRSHRTHRPAWEPEAVSVGGRTDERLGRRQLTVELG